MFTDFTKRKHTNVVMENKFPQLMVNLCDQKPIHNQFYLHHTRHLLEGQGN